jgi:excinuclease UvrABC nuclease subunit
MIKIGDKNLILNDYLKSKPGVYKLIAFDKKGNIIPINRFIGTDQNGILYIGKSKNLLKRMTKLRRGIINPEEEKGHIAIRRIKSIKNILNYIDITSLRISIDYIEFPESAKEFEKTLLNKYTEEFGERPPLNKQ